MSWKAILKRTYDSSPLGVGVGRAKDIPIDNPLPDNPQQQLDDTRRFTHAEADLITYSNETKQQYDERIARGEGAEGKYLRQMWERTGKKPPWAKW